MNKRKEFELITPKRTTRQRCFVEMLEIHFDFVKDDELLKYKYICGEALSKKEWEKCLVENMPISFAQWEEFTKEKYGEYSKEQLEEFQKHLKEVTCNNNFQKVGRSLIYPALLSSVFSAVFSGIFSVIMNVQIWWLSSLLILIILPPTFGALMGPIYLILKNILISHVEQRMYKYYRKMIQNIIDKK